MRVRSLRAVYIEGQWLIASCRDCMHVGLLRDLRPSRRGLAFTAKANRGTARKGTFQYAPRAICLIVRFRSDWKSTAWWWRSTSFSAPTSRSCLKLAVENVCSMCDVPADERYNIERDCDSGFRDRMDLEMKEQPGTQFGDGTGGFAFRARETGALPA